MKETKALNFFNEKKKKKTKKPPQQQQKTMTTPKYVFLTKAGVTYIGTPAFEYFV